MKKKFTWIRVIELAVILMAVMIFAVSVGSADLTISDSLKIVCSRIPGIRNMIDISDMKSTYETIVWQVRMPRVCMSVIVGAALAVVGACFQGVFENPLADPYVLGVSSGAALFATFAMLSGLSLSFLGLGTVGVFAFAGALITVFVVYGVAKIGGKISVTNMLLIGTAISTMLSSIISLLMIFHHDQITKVYLWTMGSFSSANWKNVLFVLIFAVIGISVIIMFAGKLNIMMMGEEDAKCLGVDTKKIRLLLVIIASMIVAACVSVSGIIGFVGLIIPHSIRVIGGSDNKKVLPYSVLIGAIFMSLCDTLARTVAAPTEIPVGVITAICGAPYFVILVLSKKRKI